MIETSSLKSRLHILSISITNFVLFLFIDESTETVPSGSITGSFLLYLFLYIDAILCASSSIFNVFPEAILTIVRGDAEKFLYQSKDYDVILADPPYGKANLEDLAQKAIKRLKKNGIMIIESSKNENWQPAEARIKTYGDTQLTIFRN